MTKGMAEKNKSQQGRQEKEREQIQRQMNLVKHKIVVLSGKGGVGKSTVSANIAASLSAAGRRVGLLDVDIHGPSIPKMFSLENEKMTSRGDRIVPVSVSENLAVISMGFLLQSRDDPVIWRGPMKYQAIKQFLKDVDWGRLDYMVIDCPPGTGDEPLSVIQLIGKADGAVIVTTPQQISVCDVRKAVVFCRDLNLPVIGVIENMSGFVCPECGHGTDIFSSGGGEKMACEMGVAFLGKIPIDPRIVEACDSGQPYVEKYRESSAAAEFSKSVERILSREKENNLNK